MDHEPTQPEIVCICSGGPIAGYQYAIPRPMLGNVQELFHHAPNGTVHVYAAKYGGGHVLHLQHLGVLQNRREALRKSLAQSQFSGN